MNCIRNLLIKGGIRSDIYICFFLLISTITVYVQVKNHDFINFDDNSYVTESIQVQSGITPENIIRAFRFSQKGDKTYYHPVTTLSHMLDGHLFNLSPGAHHLSNLILHLLNSILLFLMLRSMTGRRWESAFVSALFALHPLNVESVAWISERKNLLSAFFWFLTLLSYAFYVKGKSIYRYILVLISMLLGLLAKPILVTIPCVFLLMDLWPLGRIKLQTPDSLIRSNYYLLIEKIPFFILSFFWTYISILSNQRLGFIISTDLVPLDLRLANAVVSYMKYLGKMLWPFDLAIFYPYPSEMLPAWQVVGATVFLSSVSGLILRKWKSLPWLTVGWLWYLGTLVPVLGITQNGLWPGIADRWTYIPLIGIYIIIAWGGSLVFQKRPRRRIELTAISLVLISILCIITSYQTHYWINSITLFRHAISATRNNYLAYNNIALAFKENNINTNCSIEYLLKSVKINPSFVKSHYNLAMFLYEKKRYHEAVMHCLQAINLKPDLAMAHYLAGKSLAAQQQFQGALIYLQNAKDLLPESYEISVDIGIVLEKTGKMSAAIQQYKEALNLNPDCAEAHNYLGRVLKNTGKLTDASKHFLLALSLNPEYAEAYNNMGNLSKVMGQTEEAVRYYNEALRLRPDLAEVHNNLGAIMFHENRLDDAILHYKKALESNPEIAEIHKNLGDAFFRKGNMEEAIVSYRKALEIKPEWTNTLHTIAFILSEKTDYKDAIAMYKTYLKHHPGDSKIYYNIACLYAKRRDSSSAVTWLKKAIKEGYNNWQLIKTDKDLESIRGTLEYMEMAKELME